MEKFIAKAGILIENKYSLLANIPENWMSKNVMGYVLDR